MLETQFYQNVQEHFITSLSIYFDNVFVCLLWPLYETFKKTRIWKRYTILNVGSDRQYF